MSEKITFDKLKNKEVPLKIKAFQLNGETIEVKEYLPINDKLNPVQMDVYTTLEIVYAYSNIKFTEEEKANPAALYDELEKYDIANKVIAAIPETEYKFIIEGVEETIAAYYAYQNSVLGILENVSKDYSALNFDATELQKKMSDPTQLTLLKNIMDKLG